MKVEDLYQLIVRPELLTEHTLPGLRDIIDKYPYFQTARILYLKNLSVLNDSRFLSELKQMSVYVQDRKKLFVYVEGEKFGLYVKQTEKAVTDKDSFSLIDSFLSTYENNIHDSELDLSKILPSSGISSDYIQTLPSVESPEENSTQLYRQDLIDSFIDEESQRGRVGLLIDETSESTIPPNIESDPIVTIEESSFSETLARIYVKQKRYEKALQIIQKLSLKYPEKNVYFADQIRFLEKLIINTKK